jgi:intraflagellar transport protein 81
MEKSDRTRFCVKNRDLDIEEKIVSLLHEHFNLNFTLYQFSEISGRDLLELLNTAVHHVSDLHPEKLGSEKPEATVYRITEFLRTLRYDFPCEPEEWEVRLSSADKQLIHPVLHWLLQDLACSRKNAYKARYADEVMIPEEIRLDPTVNEMTVQHRELREHFVQVLDEHEVLGETSVDALKKQIADLESGKATLASKIAAFKRQLGRQKNVDELLKWTSKLREETDRELKLKGQLQRLSDEKRGLLQRQERAAQRLRNAKGAPRGTCVAAAQKQSRREGNRVLPAPGRRWQQEARRETEAAPGHEEGTCGGRRTDRSRFRRRRSSSST